MAYASVAVHVDVTSLPHLEETLAEALDQHGRACAKAALRGVWQWANAQYKVAVDESCDMSLSPERRNMALADARVLRGVLSKVEAEGNGQ